MFNIYRMGCECKHDANFAFDRPRGSVNYLMLYVKTQAIFDFESQETLEIVFQSKIYDMCVLYSDGNDSTWGQFLDSIEKALTFDNSTFTSDYKANARVAKMNIKFLIQTIEGDNG